ncbi:MAG TPA: hypothetical protein VGQ63_03355 [Pseudolabrys sp.]|nr:hypothetical protein [Pseudolabrys sp.]
MPKIEEAEPAGACPMADGRDDHHRRHQHCGQSRRQRAQDSSWLPLPTVLLIGGCTSRPQANMGPLQDIPHVDILRPVTRTSRTARVAAQVMRELDEAVARAMGDADEPGPVYIEIPTDVLRTPVASQLVLEEWMAAKPPRAVPPSASDIALAGDALWSARRLLVITGRGARQESRGLVPADHPAVVGAVRAAAMIDAHRRSRR